MMVPETLSERWTNVSLVARKEERHITEFHTTVLAPYRSCQDAQTYGFFNENTTLINLLLSETGSLRYICMRQPSAVQRSPVKGASR